MRQTSSFQYTGNNLSKVLDATGTGYEYFYNNKNNLIGAKSSEGNQYIIHNYSNGNPYRVRTMTSDHSAAIQANETYYIRLMGSGKYLTADGTTSGSSVSQAAFRGATNQKWKVEQTTDGYFKLLPANATNISIDIPNSADADGTNIILYGTHTGDNQKLAIKPQLFKLEYNSEYRGFRIKPKSNEASSVNIAQTSLVDGGAVIFYANEDTANSHFVLEECSKEMESTISYTSDGNYVSKTTDERGNSTTYNYDDTKDLLLSTTNAKGATTSYTYNGSNDRLLSVTASYSTEAPSTVSYTYNTDGTIKTITSPSATAYSFTYDSFGRRLATKVGNKTLGSYEYLDNYSSLVKKFTYGNGSYKEYSYDTSDRIVTEHIDGKQTKGYTYDKLGNVAKESHYQNGALANTITYGYDLSGRLTGLTDTKGQALKYVYDKYNRVTHEYYNTGENDVTTGYDYGNNSSSNSEKTGLLYGVSYDGKYTFQYGYDELNRLAQKTYWTGTAAHVMYTYMDGSEKNRTTSLVDGLLLYNKMSAEATSGTWTRYNYTYDTLGNITSIKKNGVTQETYAYDSKNQLQAVFDEANDKTRVYVYDAGGNIQKVNENQNGVTTQIKSYSYEDSQWGDLLTEYNGDEITYDAIGNPLTYRDGMEMTWINARQLLYISGLSQNVTYLYDGDGYRTHKKVGANANIIYNYIDGVLKSEEYLGRQMLYLYDENGHMAGVKVIEDDVESTYYYQTNIQGDVIGILNEAGIQVAAYTYDEWGKVTSITGSDAEGIGALNPIRYRGYYYDTETGFYYLNSRYYDPEVGRFINSDSVVAGTGESVQGYNLFSYCNNNPIMLEDSDGNWPKWAKKIVRAAKKAVKVAKKTALKITEKIVNAFAGSFHAEAGVGIGLSYSSKAGPLTYSAGAYHDSFTIGVKNGRSYTASKGTAGAQVKATKDYSFGYSTEYEHRYETSCIRDFGDDHHVFSNPVDVFNCLSTTKDPLQFSFPVLDPIQGSMSEDLFVGIGADAHIFFGGHYTLGINVSEFFRILVE